MVRAFWVYKGLLHARKFDVGASRMKFLVSYTMVTQLTGPANFYSTPDNPKQARKAVNRRQNPRRRTPIKIQNVQKPTP